MSSTSRFLTIIATALTLAACTAQSEKIPYNAADQPEPDEDEEITTAQSGVRYETVAESFVTALTPEHNLDSPASWRHPDGSTWVIASGKKSDSLLVFDGDSGALLQIVGSRGEGPGQLRRPNGVFVIDDLLLVVERDNRRVQAFRLPNFISLGSFGQGELLKPYGLWLRKSDGGYEMLVSDAYMSDGDEDQPPPLTQLDRRIKRYQVRLAGERVAAELLSAFGATDAAGAIRVTESIWGDPARQRLLIAEEDQPTGTRLRVYDFNYRYAGQDLGAEIFHAQAEGMALWACPDGSGYWLTTDQYKDRSVFHVFDRDSLAHLGAFAGKVTANTDGVWLQQEATRAFPAGVFYAVHDDQAVAAFDWRAIAAALGLRESCSASNR